MQDGDDDGICEGCAGVGVTGAGVEGAMVARALVGWKEGDDVGTLVTGVLGALVAAGHTATRGRVRPS